jgi:predicted transcriptional regulator
MVILLAKNRDRLSIIAAILDSANGGSSKTQIMFGANLSFSLLEKYLDIAIDSDFLHRENSKYYLTKLGQEYLKKYKIFENQYNEAKNLLEDLICERELLVRLCRGSEKNNSVKSFVDAE